MADFSISPQDGQALQQVFHDPSFYSSNPEAQRQKLSSLAVFRELPESSRSKVIDAVLSKKDLIRQRLGVSMPQPKPQGPSTFDRASNLLEGGINAASRFAHSPTVQRVTGAVGDFISTNPLTATAKAFGKNIPSPGDLIAGAEEPMIHSLENYSKTNPNASGWMKKLAVGEVVPLRVMQDLQQSLANWEMSPLGRVFHGLPELSKLPKGELAKKLTGLGVKAANVGIVGDQMRGAGQSIANAVANPTSQNKARAISDSLFAVSLLGRSRQGKASETTANTKAGTESSSASVPQISIEQARKYKVTPQEYEKALGMSAHDLAGQVQDTSEQIRRLEDARRYNEFANKAIPEHEARIAKLKQARDQAELSLDEKKTQALDKEIGAMEGRLGAVREKVLNNRRVVADLSQQNLEAKRRLYTDQLRDREAPYANHGKKVYPGQTPAKAQPSVQEPNPLRKQAEVRALPAGKPIPQARPIHREYVADEESGEFKPKPIRPPLKIEAPQKATGPFPMGGKVKGQPEQITGAPEKKLIAGAERKALPAVPERTPEGAIPARAVTEQAPPQKPIRGQIAAPEKEQEQPKQLTAPQHKYQPQTIEYRNGKPVNVIQPREQTTPPPKSRSTRPVVAKDITPRTPVKAEETKAPEPKREATPAPPRMGQPKTSAPPVKAEEKPKNGNAALPNWMKSADEETQSAYARIRERLKRGEKGSLTIGGREPEEDLGPLMPDLQKVGRHLFDYGVKNFKDWSRAMTSDIGDFIKPHLDRIWEAMGSAPKAGTLQEGKLTELPKEEIHVDPKRFQFKSKAVGRAGVSDKLSDITAVDPQKMGTLAVWRDPADGKTYVVNGHHRLELAKRTGYDQPIAVRYIDAKSAAEARKVGALINIGEGQGEPIDVAKLIRDGKLTPEQVVKEFNISSRNPLLKQGASLANLDDRIFDQVASGDIPEGTGAVIGETLKDPVDQEAAVRLWKQARDRGRRITDAEFREAIELQVADAPKQRKETEDLFGTHVDERNLALERGEVSQYIRSQLASDKRLFPTVSREVSANKLGETGNTIKTDENAERAKQIAQTLEIYDKLKRTSGPVKEALDQAAKEIGDGENPATVKRRAYDQIRAGLGTDLSRIFSGGNAENRPNAGGSEAGGSVPPTTRRGLPGEQRGLGTEKETERFNQKREGDLNKARAEAEMRAPIQQGDKSRPIKADSPLFRNKPIDTSEPQGSMFTEPPPKKKDSARVESKEGNETTPPPRSREGRNLGEGSPADRPGVLGTSGQSGLESSGSVGRSGATGESKAESPQAPFEQRYITVGNPPQVDTSKVPQPTGGYKLRPDQAQTAALAIRELEKGGGFLSASGTGVGKTGSGVAAAKHFTDQGKKVLIVAPKNVWAFDNENNPGGTWGDWFKQYGIKPTYWKPGTPVDNGKAYISTYEWYKQFPTDKDTYLLLDEAHNLKNAESGKASAGLKQIDKSGGVYYMTATPADKPIHIQYLAKMGILQGKSPAEALADLGMELVQRQHKDGSVSQVWQTRKGFTPKMIRERFANLFDQMIREGKMRKEELSLENMDLGVDKIPLSSEAHDVSAKIERELGMEGAMGLKKAVILGHVRRQQEPYKIDHVVDKARQDIANGRKVVVFLSRVNRSDVVRHDRVWMGGEKVKIDTLIHSSEGTAKTLKQRFKDLGFKVAEIHGASETGNTEAMRQFQSGEADVVIATAPSGGVGINLDDTKGTAPRTVYVMTPEFDAMNNVQLVGRGYRASTKSRPVVRYLFADTPIDNWNMSILSDKIKTLQSVVAGESGKLNMIDYVREAPEEEEEKPKQEVRTQTPPRRRKYQPEVGDDVFFVHEGRWRTGKVTSIADGRVKVMPTARVFGGKELDITNAKFNKAR